VSEIASLANEFEQTRIRVVLISFENEEGTRRWRARVTAAQRYPILLDPTLQVYNLFQLGKMGNPWAPRTVVYYAYKRLIGTTLPSPTGGDTHQLGGDFVVDTTTRALVFAHRSTESVDRPSARAILQAVSSSSASASVSTPP